MNPQLQRRIQRYGWDRAVDAYEPGWQAQLRPAQDVMLDLAGLESGDHVLDVACGTGLVTFRAATAVGETGSILGMDIAGQMIETARRLAVERGVTNTRFERCDAERLPVADATFDAAICGLGLMYVPDPLQALYEMHRALKPGGRMAAAVWGARTGCGWAEIFPITDARVASEVCPMFFHLGTGDTLARVLEAAGFTDIRSARLKTTLHYASADDAIGAVFRGGPVALAYSRFDAATRAAVHAEYLDSIATHRIGDGYRIPGEFVVAAGCVPQRSIKARRIPMTETATNVNNGVNVDALLAAREVLTEQPQGAQFKWRAACEWKNGTHSHSTVESFFGLGGEQKHRTTFGFDADHPELFASEDHGATPVEYVLVGLASCLTAGLAAVAQNRNIQLRSVKATIEGDMDIQGILGIDSDVRNGFDGIRVTYDIDADASRQDIEALVAQSQKRSAVYDIVTNPTNVTVSVS